MLRLLWGSRSRGPYCFAQGQDDLDIVIHFYIYIYMCVFWSIAFFFSFYMPPRKPEHVSWPEFNIISTLPRRSSTSQLEFVGIKTKPWHSGSVQNQIMFVLVMTGCVGLCPLSLQLALCCKCDLTDWSLIRISKIFSLKSIDPPTRVWLGEAANLSTVSVHVGVLWWTNTEKYTPYPENLKYWIIFDGKLHCSLHHVSIIHPFSHFL